MFRALYDWTLRLAGHRHADRYMAAVSFAESSFFPIPPDVMLVPMILARRDQAYRIAAICTLASVLGGMLGYAIGYFLYESVGQWLIHVYGMGDKIADARAWFAKWGAAVILIKGLTPIPFKLVTIVSGVMEFNFAIFVVTAAITRGARFFLVAYLLKKFGEPVQKVLEERLNLIGWIVLAALIGGFALVALV
ncbi:YqaA family protein [Sphingomonas sp.]|uniref:YqaA family protein n=1 Tax=Sphingomonas sp. TaxID=28214 RepID=UPI001EB89D60|nr:YqaA family protein [Sphingomonas sp.]MBX3592944.1 DedA family protein [Sphingomonas sp.]